MRAGLIFSALLLILGIPDVHAESPAAPQCRDGGKVEEVAYADTVKLYGRPGFKSIKEEAQVLGGLRRAVVHQCRQAATMLFSIKFGAATESHDSAEIKELFWLVQQANKIDEGWFEAGTFYLLESTEYFSPRTAVGYLRKAAEKGDRYAIDLLIQYYDGKMKGSEPDPAQANFWRTKFPAVNEIIR
jgi:hypothetical protein